MHKAKYMSNAILFQGGVLRLFHTVLNYKSDESLEIGQKNHCGPLTYYILVYFY